MIDLPSINAKAFEAVADGLFRLRPISEWGPDVADLSRPVKCSANAVLCWSQIHDELACSVGRVGFDHVFRVFVFQREGDKEPQLIVHQDWVEPVGQEGEPVCVCPQLTVGHEAGCEWMAWRRRSR